MSEEKNAGTDYYPIKELAERVPTFTYRRLRWVVEQRRKNGLHPYVRKVGRRLYVSESGLYEWLDQQPA